MLLRFLTLLFTMANVWIHITLNITFLVEIKNQLKYLKNLKNNIIIIIVVI